MSEPDPTPPSNTAPTRFEIPERKLVAYLLDPSHPRGGSKARFLFAFGFHTSRPSELAEALAAHVSTAQGRRVAQDGAGEKLVCEGPIPAPDGRDPWVRSIWQIQEDGAARLISLVPLRNRP